MDMVFGDVLGREGGLDAKPRGGLVGGSRDVEGHDG
jgi:hypothetical protein